MRTLESVVGNPSGLDSFANYIGECEFPELDCLVTQTRDSHVLERSNFRSALRLLGGEGDNVEVHRFGHWSCGWWEALAIKQGTPEHKIAEDIAAGLEDYPVVDESDWSELEWSEAQDFWATMSVKERVEICQRFEVSVFAARHDSIPQDDNGRIYEYLTAA